MRTAIVLLLAAGAASGCPREPEFQWRDAEGRVCEGVCVVDGEPYLCDDDLTCSEPPPDRDCEIHLSQDFPDSGGRVWSCWSPQRPLDSEDNQIFLCATCCGSTDDNLWMSLVSRDDPCTPLICDASSEPFPAAGYECIDGFVYRCEITDETGTCLP